jgi:nicotinamidase-related amidase
MSLKLRDRDILLVTDVQNDFLPGRGIGRSQW